MFPKSCHRYLFLLSLACLSSGALFGASLMSIGQISLSANWFLEGNYFHKIKSLYRNKLFWISISLFLLHLLGMDYTSNLQLGLADLGNKIPLLILPILFFSTTPLSTNEFKVLFHLFYLAVVLSSLYCFAVFLGYTHKTILNPREASVFMSHIRFSLFIAFAVCGLVYSFIHETTWWLKLACALAIVWLLFFMYKLELLTGIVCLVIVGIVALFSLLFKRLSKRTALGFLLVISTGIIILISQLKTSLTLFDASAHNPNNQLRTQTVNHRSYLQDTLYQLAENGNLIGININDYELQQEWEKRSNIRYNSSDKKGNELRYTILHYLASKGFTKDSVGIRLLSNDDVLHIEQGFTNYLYCSHGNVVERWRELMWEYTKYQRGENPSGHTLTMRLEFWKTAWHIIQSEPLLGVGTGDIQDAFHKAYTETQTKLDKRWWLRCHNQYLAITVGFGLLGLIVFLFCLIYPAFAWRKELHPLYWCFFIISLVSFLTEDTLETQAGVTFFALFNTLFLWLACNKKQNTTIV